MVKVTLKQSYSFGGRLFGPSVDNTEESKIDVPVSLAKALGLAQAAKAEKQEEEKPPAKEEKVVEPTPGVFDNPDKTTSPVKVDPPIPDEEKGPFSPGFKNLPGKVLVNGRLNLDHPDLTVQHMAVLDGIGLVSAKAILDYRNQITDKVFGGLDTFKQAIKILDLDSRVKVDQIANDIYFESAS
jgi:hypothetical protein